MKPPTDVFSIGPDADPGGNSFGHSVSKAFDEREVRALYERLNSLEIARELVRLNCNRPVPQYEFSLVLWREGEYRERQLRLQMTPRLYESDRCLEQAVSHLFDRTVEAADTGERIDYGYKDPHTGKPLDTSKWAHYVSPPPECPCQHPTPPQPDRK